MKTTAPPPKLRHLSVNTRVNKVLGVVQRHPGETTMSLAARTGYAVRTVLADLRYLAKQGQVEQSTRADGSPVWSPVQVEEAAS